MPFWHFCSHSTLKRISLANPSILVNLLDKFIQKRTWAWVVVLRHNLFACDKGFLTTSTSQIVVAVTRWSTASLSMIMIQLCCVGCVALRCWVVEFALVEQTIFVLQNEGKWRQTKEEQTKEELAWRQKDRKIQCAACVVLIAFTTSGMCQAGTHPTQKQASGCTDTGSPTCHLSQELQSCPSKWWGHDKTTC